MAAYITILLAMWHHCIREFFIILADSPAVSLAISEVNLVETDRPIKAILFTTCNVKLKHSVCSLLYKITFCIK